MQPLYFIEQWSEYKVYNPKFEVCITDFRSVSIIITKVHKNWETFINIIFIEQSTYLLNIYKII